MGKPNISLMKKALEGKPVRVAPESRAPRHAGAGYQLFDQRKPISNREQQAVPTPGFEYKEADFPPLKPTS